MHSNRNRFTILTAYTESYIRWYIKFKFNATIYHLSLMSSTSWSGQVAETSIRRWRKHSWTWRSVHKISGFRPMAKKLPLLSTHPCAYLKLHCDTRIRVLPLWEHTIRTSCKKRLVDKFVITNYHCSSDIRKRQESRLQIALQTHIGWEMGSDICSADTCADIVTWADWKAYQLR